MGWRDLIVTSQPRLNAPPQPTRGNFEDIGNIELKYENKSSLSLENSPQNSIPPNASSISSKPSTSASLDPVESSGPTAPLTSGWLVAYRDQHGILRGGCDDRAHGTVQDCTWDGVAWTVILTDRQQLPLTAICSVGRTNPVGEVLAAWTVRGHGYDGNKGRG